MINKAQQQVNNQYGRPFQNTGQRNHRHNRPSDKISIDYIPPKDKEARAADKAGDFIDFEEIK